MRRWYNKAQIILHELSRDFPETPSTFRTEAVTEDHGPPAECFASSHRTTLLVLRLTMDPCP